MSFNKLKSTTVYGNFRNEIDSLSSNGGPQASAFFEGSVEISGDINSNFLDNALGTKQNVLPNAVFLENISSDIQQQLDNKQDTISTAVFLENITSDVQNQLDNKQDAISTVVYLQNITSDVQAQLDSKVPTDISNVESRLDGIELKTDMITIDNSINPPELVLDHVKIGTLVIDDGIFGTSTTVFNFSNTVTCESDLVVNGNISSNYLSNALNEKQDRVTNISDIEISFLDGLVGNAQNQINNLSTQINNLNTSKQSVVPNVSSTEIGYLSEVTSDIQSQLDSKITTADINNKQDKVANVTDVEISKLEGLTQNVQNKLNKFNKLLEDFSNNSSTRTTIEGRDLQIKFYKTIPGPLISYNVHSELYDLNENKQNKTLFLDNLSENVQSTLTDFRTRIEYLENLLKNVQLNENSGSPDEMVFDCEMKIDHQVTIRADLDVVNGGDVDVQAHSINNIGAKVDELWDNKNF